MNPVVDDLRAAIGSDDVIVDADRRATHEVDWTGRYGGRCLAVVRPRSTAAVAEIVGICTAHDVAMIPQGGNTGLVGGGVPGPGPRDGTVIVSTAGLDEVGPVDRAAMQVSLGAGVTIARWRDVARVAGLDTPVDFAARDSATVGGAIATNAGGSRVVRFGTMRAQVTGIEAVLADGGVVGALDGLPKETAGLHWPSLFAGSEGTLGLITRARLRLVPWYGSTATALVVMSTLDDAIELLRSLRARLPALDAVEIVQPAAFELVAAHLGTSPPVPAPGPRGSVLVIDVADHRDPTDDLLTVLAEAGGIVDSAVAVDPVRREELLAYRDRVTEAIATESTRVGTPTFKLDVAVPVARLGELLAAAHAAADADGCRLIPFGHLAEGNLHLNHLGANDTAAIADAVLPAVARLGGTISAEHGIGVAKASHLGLIRSAHDLAAQKAVAGALDPGRLLNPGVLGR